MKDRIINLLAAFQKDNLGNSFPLGYCLPLYHTVSDMDLPHIKHVIPYKNTKQFEDDLDCFSKYFQWVDWSEFKAYTSGNFKSKKKIALLTFDDGFREFYDIVAPVLERKGIYACNFINPAFIDNKDMMFRCKASILLDTVQKSKNINPEIYHLLSLKDHTHEALQNHILNVKYDGKDILEQLAEKLDVDFKKYSKENKPYLSTEELQTLTRKGFGISAHSWDHPKYGDLSLDQQIETTEKTFNYLKNNNFLYETFAFPFTDFGVKKEFFEALFTNKDIYCSFGCAGIKLDSVEKNFQRIPMEMGESGEKILKKEMAYFTLKKVLQKNTIIRK